MYRGRTKYSACHIGDDICKTANILINYYLLYKLWSIHQQILEKYLNFCLFKCKKVVINFYQNFVGNYFRWWWFFGNFKTRFWKGSCTPTYILISKWGENILRKMIIKPQFNYKRYSTSAQSMVCAESIAQISFATKKHTQNKDTMLNINMIYMNASPFGILKIWKFCCFWLISFSLQKEVSAFWVFCGPRNSWANLQSFDTPALHLVRPLYSFRRFSFFY